MIRINLLPQEYRKSERTSPKVFAATLAGVVSVCSVLGWFGFVYFGELGELQVQHADVADQLERKTQRAKYYDQLVAQKGEHQKRVDTIQRIGVSRKLWTRELDQLVDVVNNNGNTERHLAWFESIKVQDPGNNKPPTLDLPGEVQGSGMGNVANLHEDLKAAPFYTDVDSKTDPEGKLQIDAGKQPPESMQFKLQMTYKSVDQWKKNEGIKLPGLGGKKKRGRR